MAVADVSPAHQDAVDAFLKRPQNVVGRYRGGAHDPDGTDIGGILHSADTGKVGSTVRAPVAYECQNFRFEWFRFHNDSLKRYRLSAHGAFNLGINLPVAETQQHRRL